MRTDYQEKRFLAKNREAFIGMDVHKESWQTTIRAEGEEVFHGRLPSEYQALKKLIERLPGCKVKVAYEAGPCGFSLYDKLTADGIETIVVPPTLIPVESGNKVKTDRRDSRKLAHLLERDMLKKVYVLSEEDRADRELVRTRRQINEHRSDAMRQIKSKLLFYGIKPPFTAEQSWSKAYVKWLKEYKFDSDLLRLSLDYLIGLYEYLTSQLVKLTKEVVLLARSKKYSKRVKLLKSVPGIGTLTAIEILVELQDMKRFKSSDQLAAYIGLTPSEFSSGQYVRQGRITRSGNKRVRACLVESSWILIAKDPFMRKRYQELKNRKGGKKAIIAIARMLIIRVRRILLDSEPYLLKAA
jgi:transposase